MATSTSRVSWTGGADPPIAQPAGAQPWMSGGADWHLLSVREVAAACRLSEKAVRRAIDAGELPAAKLRSRLRITPQDFEGWIASCRRAERRPPTESRPRLGRRPAAGTFRALFDSDRGAQL
jgi:excisionase family DNA binding protein